MKPHQKVMTSLVALALMVAMAKEVLGEPKLSMIGPRFQACDSRETVDLQVNKLIDQDGRAFLVTGCRNFNIYPHIMQMGGLPVLSQVVGTIERDGYRFEIYQLDVQLPPKLTLFSWKRTDKSEDI